MYCCWRKAWLAAGVPWWWWISCTVCGSPAGRTSVPPGGSTCCACSSGGCRLIWPADWMASTAPGTAGTTCWGVDEPAAAGAGGGSATIGGALAWVQMSEAELVLVVTCSGIVPPTATQACGAQSDFVKDKVKDGAVVHKNHTGTVILSDFVGIVLMLDNSLSSVSEWIQSQRRRQLQFGSVAVWQYQSLTHRQWQCQCAWVRVWVSVGDSQFVTTFNCLGARLWVGHRARETTMYILTQFNDQATCKTCNVLHLNKI